MFNNNENNSTKRTGIDEYLDVLCDAAKQRNSKNYDRAREMANCITEMMQSLKKHKIKTLEETIHVLTSVVLVPIQILEKSSEERSRLMRDLATAFTVDIMKTQISDTMMKGSEVGDELDRLRWLSSTLFDKQ